MTNKTVAEKLARYLVCEKVDSKKFETEVAEGILLNPTLEQVCDPESQKSVGLNTNYMNNCNS